VTAAAAPPAAASKKRAPAAAAKEPAAKRQAAAAVAVSTPSGGGGGGCGGEARWPLSQSKFVGVGLYKGRLQVDLREWFGAPGELKPGKKGISLRPAEWSALRAALPDARRALAVRDLSFARELGGERRVGVSEYGGRPLLQVREYYEKGGERLPGRMGLALDEAGAAALAAAADAIDAAAAALGQAMPPAAGAAEASVAAAGPSKAAAAASSSAVPAAPATAAAAPAATTPAAASSSGGEAPLFVLDLGASRRASLSRWKGALQVDLREWYAGAAGGELQPGKKGISLKREEWRALRAAMPAIDASAAAGPGGPAVSLPLGGAGGAAKLALTEDFKGARFVVVREFYGATGELKPGKKGLNLRPLEWAALRDGAAALDAALERAAAA